MLSLWYFVMAARADMNKGVHVDFRFSLIKVPRHHQTSLFLSLSQLCCSVHWLCSLIRLSSCSDKVLMAATAAACILPRIQFQWGRDYHRFSLTLIRSCECPLAHPCDRVGLFSILPKCKPNQSRSLLEIFCDCPVPRNKNSTSCDLQSPMQSSSAALSSLLSAHSSPHFWALLLWLSSAFGIQCLTPASRVFTCCSVYLGVLALRPLCWFQPLPQVSAERLSSQGVSEYAINKFFF